MRLSELLRIIWINVKQNRSKVILNSLGIIAGTLTIILVIAIGQGGENEAAKQFSGLSADTIYLKPDQSAILSEKRRKIERLSIENIKQILEESNALVGMYLRESTYTEVKFGKEKTNIEVVGVTKGFAEISNFSFSAGWDFPDEYYEKAASAAVIGYELANTYFKGPADAIDQTILVDQKRYKVIGVLARSGDGLQGLSPDRSIFLPYQTFEAKNLASKDDYPEAVGKADGVKSVQLAMAEIKSTVNYYMNDGDKYLVEDAGSRIEAATESAKTMNLLLISLAAIVFAVGGIGIMNVLFATIRERTKEIGILKALGMKRADILLQFLLESVAIGVFGGAAGAVLSFGAIPLIEKYTDIPVSPSFQGIAAAFIFAVVTGTLFGFYPAYKASKLIPVDALNVE